MSSKLRSFTARPPPAAPTTNGSSEMTSAPSFKSRNFGRIASFTINPDTKQSARPDQSEHEEMRVKGKRTFLAKDFIIHENNVCTGHKLVYARTLKHIRMLELDVTHTNAPHTRTHHHLRALLTRHLRGFSHHFDAERGAPTLQGSVQYDV